MPTSVAVIAIVSIVGGLLYAAYEQHVKLKLGKQASEADKKTLAEIDELKARIEVLEKIVTDDKYQLKQEIEQLSKKAS